MALYTDLDISFAKDDFSRDLSVVSEIDAVKQSVVSLLKTAFFERPFQPSLGNAILLRLFEPYDEITELAIVSDIKAVIRRFEPRATLKYVDFYKSKGPNQEQLNDHEVLVELGFVVQNIPQLQTAQLLLTRLR